MDACRLIRWSPKSRVWPCSPACVMNSHLLFQELSMRIQHFCACCSLWKISLPLTNVHSVFLLRVRGGSAKEDFSSSLSFSPPFLPAVSPHHPYPHNIQWASMVCVYRWLTLRLILCHNYFPTGLSSQLDINYKSKKTVLVTCAQERNIYVRSLAN